jgi:hypothetical protein
MPSTVVDLLMVRVRVESRDLEELLEALAGLEFPLNPELFPSGGETIVEFPAYGHQLEEIYSVLPDPARVDTVTMLAEIGL